jgi:hypothetical protein
MVYSKYLRGVGENDKKGRSSTFLLRRTLLGTNGTVDLNGQKAKSWR